MTHLYSLCLGDIHTLYAYMSQKNFHTWVDRTLMLTRNCSFQFKISLFSVLISSSEVTLHVEQWLYHIVIHLHIAILIHLSYPHSYYEASHVLTALNALPSRWRSWNLSPRCFLRVAVLLWASTCKLHEYLHTWLSIARTHTASVHKSWQMPEAPWAPFYVCKIEMLHAC